MSKIQAEKKNNKIVISRGLTAKEKAQKMIKEKSFSQMSRSEKDELLELLLIEQGIIEK